MRIIFFGTSGSMSAPALAAILDAGIEVSAVAIAAPPGSPPARVLPPLPPPRYNNLVGASLQPNMIQLAAAHRIPVLALGRLNHPYVREACAADLALVACFTRRIPEALLSVARHGFYNLHPSPLPHLRGPDPLFWAIREGWSETSVSIHRMDAAVDTGPIAAQAVLALAESEPLSELERRAGHLGGQLFVQVIRGVEANQLQLRPQPSGGSYRTAPNASDLALDTSWPVLRAFRFMRATAEWGWPFPLHLGTRTLELRSALEMRVGAQIDQPYIEQNGKIEVQFSDGVLHASL